MFRLQQTPGEQESPMDSPEHEERAVREYVVGQAPDETVEQAEKVSSEHVFGTRYDVWDVHTDKSRWWVITPMTNLYLQDDIRSMNQAISLHIGLTERVLSRERGEIDGSRNPSELEKVFRKVDQASEALDRAEEAEDFQAVGVRLRECLIAFAHALADPAIVREGTEPPQAANFVAWAELLAYALAPGRDNAGIRKYLKAQANPTWQLVQQLTHSTNADRLEADFVHDAVRHLIGSYVLAEARKARGPSERCPACGSYRVVEDYRSAEDRSYALCSTCGWERPLPETA
jgi:hypothetical protein